MFPERLNMKLAIALALLSFASGCGSDGGSDSADAGPANAKRIFVTRTAYTGAMGGLSGADTFCDNAAAALSLGGSWTAWLSDDTVDAIDRISADGPWLDLDNKMVFANRAAVTTSPLIGIVIQENGEPVSPGVTVWTGTRAGGTSRGFNCNNWSGVSTTGTTGETGSTRNEWTEDLANHLCANDARLYCFEK